jgi:hypothetical protein
LEKNENLKQIANFFLYKNLTFDNSLLEKDNKLENEANKLEEHNMWISEKYCKNWGLREAIREFIQNQYDGVIEKVKTKKNLRVSSIGEEYLINGRKKYLEYDMIRKDDNKKFGEIRYDQNKNILYISNEGELFLADFLLGGSKEEQNNSEIIGVFGEGMKIAILALCRLSKNVEIISSNKSYSFRLKEDINFIKKSIPQKCLHCKIETTSNNSNQVQVIINNIKEDEWGNQIDNFLWLLGNDIEIYTSLDKENKELGQIIYEDYLKGKIFVKGIFVQEIEDKSKKSVPGFNVSLK